MKLHMPRIPKAKRTFTVIRTTTGNGVSPTVLFPDFWTQVALKNPTLMRKVSQLVEECVKHQLASGMFIPSLLWSVDVDVPYHPFGSWSAVVQPLEQKKD